EARVAAGVAVEFDPGFDGDGRGGAEGGGVGDGDVVVDAVELGRRVGLGEERAGGAKSRAVTVGAVASVAGAVERGGAGVVEAPVAGGVVGKDGGSVGYAGALKGNRHSIRLVAPSRGTCPARVH